MDHPAPKGSIKSHLLPVVKGEVALSEVGFSGSLCIAFSVPFGCIFLLSVGRRAFVWEGGCLTYV